MSDLLNSASLVMIPSGYKEDVVYSPVPTDGSGDLSFTRASNGTRINSAGLVEVCPWNLLEQSEDFSNAYWTKVNATITSNSTTAPNGTTTADTITDNSTNGVHCVILYSTWATSQQTASVYAKAGTSSKIFIGNLTEGRGSYFNLSDLSIVNSSNFVGSIESVGNGWYRLIATHTAASSSTFGIGLFTGTSTINYVGTGQTAYIYGAQLNIGSTAKPYFPTTDRLNVPRLTYQNGGGGCPSLLLEKQSTNYIVYSEDLTQGDWSKQNSTVTGNSTTSPDGTQNADLWYPSTNGDVSSRRLLQSCTVSTSGVNITATVYVKRNNKRWLFFAGPDATSANHNCWFDIQNGVVGTKGSAVVSATIDNIGNGWYRCSVTSLATSTTQYVFLSATDADADGTVTANGTDGMYFYGAQLEPSSYPTSYIPTTSSSATRVADYPSRSGLALTNFTFAVNFKPLAYIVELFDFEKTGSGRMFYVAVNSSGFITFNSVSGGSIGAIGSVIPINQTCKLAFKLNASTSNLTVFINGSNIGTFTTNITTFGAFFGLQSFGYNPGTQIEQIAIFPSVLTDAECISLTTI